MTLDTAVAIAGTAGFQAEDVHRERVRGRDGVSVQGRLWIMDTTDSHSVYNSQRQKRLFTSDNFLVFQASD